MKADIMAWNCLGHLSGKLMKIMTAKRTRVPGVSPSVDPKLFAHKWRGKLVREWRSFWDSDTGASWKSLMRASVDLENMEMKGLIGWLETGRFKPA